MPHVEQAVVQVLAVGAERRLARAQAAEDREPEVEQRHDQHRERQQDRDERGEQAARAEHVVGTARTRDAAGSIWPVTAIAEAAISIPTSRAPGVAHEELRRMPVERQEAGARADEDGRDELGEVEVVGLRRSVRTREVAVDEEHAVGDERDAGDQAVEAVDEVDGVHHQHDRRTR